MEIELTKRLKLAHELLESKGYAAEVKDEAYLGSIRYEMPYLVILQEGVYILIADIAQQIELKCLIDVSNAIIAGKKQDQLKGIVEKSNELANIIISSSKARIETFISYPVHYLDIVQHINLLESDKESKEQFFNGIKEMATLSNKIISVLYQKKN